MNIKQTPSSETIPFEGEEAIKPEKLLVEEFSEPTQVIEIVTHEFSAVCPFSGLPDLATVVIRYCPNGYIIELKSLKLYFVTYRQAGVYQERATQLIKQHLERVLKTDVYVETQYNTRGGIDVTCRQGGIKIASLGEEKE